MNISFNTAQHIMNNELIKTKLCSKVESLYCEEDECKNTYDISDDRIGEESINGVVYKACLENKCNYVAKWQSNKEVALNEAKMQMIAAKDGIAPNVRQVLTCPEGVIIIMDAMSMAISRLFKMLSRDQLNRTIEYNTEYFDKTIQKSGIEVEYNRDDIKSVEDLRKIRARINRILFSSGFAGLNDVFTMEDTEDMKEKRKKYIKTIFKLINRLHKLGISHNDAHLNNFMTDDKGNLKIIDFGTAKQINTHDNYLNDYKRVQRNISQYYEEGYTNLDYLVHFVSEHIDKIKNNIFQNDF